MVPKSDHLANPRFDKKPSAQAKSKSSKKVTVSSQMRSDFDKYIFFSTSGCQ